MNPAASLRSSSELRHPCARHMSTMRTWFVTVAIGLLTACASAEGTTTAGVPLVGICAILAAPADYDGREISIRGQISTDYFEFSGMRDVACPQRVISLGPQNVVESGLQELETKLAGIRDNPTSHVMATATGVLDWRPGQVPVLVIMARDYSDISIVE